MDKDKVNNKPRVSIGMPLYNAEEYLERALSAILSQSFSDFELIISDNASTDRTWEICNAYAARDECIKLYRNEKNEGATFNFERVVTLSEAEYFIWASYDDLWETEFLESCVQALDQNPFAVLAFTSIQRHHIDENRMEILPLNFYELPEQDWKRAIYFLQHKPLPNAIIYGLYRRSLMQKILPFPSGYGGDSLFLLKGILVGDFVQVQPTLFTQAYVGRRDIRKRLWQYTGHRTGIIRLLKLDWVFISQLFQITQSVAPNFRARLQLFWVALIFCYQNFGWPLSLPLLIRYGSLLLPESLYIQLIHGKKRKNSNSA